MKANRFALLATALLLFHPARAVQITIRTSEPCRVRLVDAGDRPVLPTNLPAWRGQFVMPGEASLDLGPGRYRYTLARGPEFELVRGEFEVTQGSPPVVVQHVLRRLLDLRREGWWSGETHVHRGAEPMALLMQAEDLHVGCAITWWNDANPWARTPLPTNPVVRFDGDRFYDVLGGEDERGGGALLYFGLKQPLTIAGSGREFPSALKFLRQARSSPGVWVDVEKPFWWDMPVWVASGLVDSIGIANNHQQLDGMLDNEAWGRPRDRARYPGPHGNGRWTQDIYYQLLEAGVRLPPSAGSASGVLPNPVGYNRMYAFVEGELTWAKWWDSVRRGRVFVSNGPLLRVRADGQLPGHVFRRPESGPLSLTLTLRLDSRDPVSEVEIVHNGRVIRSLPRERLDEPVPLMLSEPGWFLFRAVADVPHTFRFASTGPFYVEAADPSRRVSRASARFFADWVRERMRQLKLEDAGQREEVLAEQGEALRFWERRANEATVE